MRPTLSASLLLTLFACATGENPDSDHDGFLAPLDCDDADPLVNPNAAELKGDAIDNDCDGAVDCDDPDLTGTWEGDLAYADVDTFCDDWCDRTVTGSVALDQTLLTNLDALTCLTGVGGNVTIRANGALASIAGLSNLSTVGGAVMIGQDLCDWDTIPCGNPALTSYTGLENLESAYSLMLAENDLVVDPITFGQLTTLDGLTVYGHAALAALPAFPALTSLVAMEVVDNPSLATLSEFDALETIDSYVYLTRNPSLTTIDGFDHVITIGEALMIGDEPGLVTISGFRSLAEVGLVFELWGNPSLASIEGFGALTYVGDYVNLIDNDALVSFAGLESLAKIDGLGLNVMDNDGLVTLDGLDSLHDIRGNLQITSYAEPDGNDALVDVTALYGLEYVGKSVVITHNPSLTDEAAMDLVAHIENIGGTVVIGDNE